MEYDKRREFWIAKSEAEADLGGARGVRGCASSLLFVITLKNYKLLFNVELIINNAPLTYFYQNNIETSLTPNYLLFGRQLLYSSNTASTVVRNLTFLSSANDKTNCITNHFRDRWRYEYVINLRETQRTSKLNKNSQN